MTHTEELEREAQQTRSQLANTLDELRASMTPGRMVDQLADYAGSGDAGVFLRTLRRQVARNPLPVTLIGTGVAWLMLSNGRADDRAANLDGRQRLPATRSAVRAADEAIHDADEAVRSTTERTAQRANEALAVAEKTVRDSAGTVYETVADTAAETGDRLADSAARATQAARERAYTFGRKATMSSRSALDFCREQPLLLAGLGLALGAVLGALLPSTEVEDRLMGEESDDAKTQAKDLASDVAAKSFESSRPADGDGPDSDTRGTTPRDS